MTRPGATTKTKPVQDIASCRAATIGVERFGECLQQGPNTCAFALPFGYGFLCQHPRLREIIENTRKVQAMAKL